MKLSEKNAKYAIVKTAFHAGGTLSFHNSLEAANRKAVNFRGTCMCGCCAVVPVTAEAREEMWNTKNNDPCAYPRYPYREYRERIEDIALYADVPEYDPNMHYSTICR